MFINLDLRTHVNIFTVRVVQYMAAMLGVIEHEFLGLTNGYERRPDKAAAKSAERSCALVWSTRESMMVISSPLSRTLI